MRQCGARLLMGHAIRIRKFTCVGSLHRFSTQHHRVVLTTAGASAFVEFETRDSLMSTPVPFHCDSSLSQEYPPLLPLWSIRVDYAVAAVGDEGVLRCKSHAPSIVADPTVCGSTIIHRSGCHGANAPVIEASAVKVWQCVETPSPAIA